MPLRSLNNFQPIACGWDVNAIAFIECFSANSVWVDVNAIAFIDFFFQRIKCGWDVNVIAFIE